MKVGGRMHTRHTLAHRSTSSTSSRKASEVSGLTLFPQPWETKSKGQFYRSSGPKHKLSSACGGGSQLQYSIIKALTAHRVKEDMDAPSALIYL